MSKFNWNKENKREAHAALLKKVNKKPATLSELDTIEYGDDGVARFTNANNKLFEHNMVAPVTTAVNPTEIKKSEPKKAAAKKTSKAK